MTGKFVNEFCMPTIKLISVSVNFLYLKDCHVQCYIFMQLGGIWYFIEHEEVIVLHTHIVSQVITTLLPVFLRTLFLFQ